jgi:hypothetical protein
VIKLAEFLNNINCSGWHNECTHLQKKEPGDRNPVLYMYNYGLKNKAKIKQEKIKNNTPKW